METFVIQIISAKNESVWYKEHIGETFLCCTYRGLTILYEEINNMYKKLLHFDDYLIIRK